MLQIAVQGMHRDRPLSRRGFLRTSLLGAGAFALPKLLEAQALAAQAGRARRDTAVIQIWLAGGPSHIDTYDLKPEAPEGFRGEFRPIATRLRGADICELMPRQARILDRFSLIRSLRNNHTGAHYPAIHWMQTGYEGKRFPPTHPSIGAITAKLRGANGAHMPPYVHIVSEPKHFNVGNPTFDAAYLGARFAPMRIKSAASEPPWGNVVQFDVPNLELSQAVDFARLDDRIRLRNGLERLSRGLDQGQYDTLDRYQQQALGMLTSPAARSAFDLTRESSRLREHYGMNAWGQAALLCRRLVEAGVTFVTLNTDSAHIAWDHHRNLKSESEKMLPVYDQMLTALIDDLVSRGLYERVLVLVWAEFGRSPHINKEAGREHWGKAGFALLGGAGLRHGQVIGATTSKGEEPRDRPLGPEDILATVYHVLGIDPRTELHDMTSRPIPVLPGGQIISDLTG